MRERKTENTRERETREIHTGRIPSLAFEVRRVEELSFVLWNDYKGSESIIVLQEVSERRRWRKRLGGKLNAYQNWVGKQENVHRG